MSTDARCSLNFSLQLSLGLRSTMAFTYSVGLGIRTATYGAGLNTSDDQNLLDSAVPPMNYLQATS